MKKNFSWRYLVRPVLHMLWPVSCPVCGRLGEPLCDECLSPLLKAPAAPRCLLCGERQPCPEHPEAPSIFGASVYGGDMSRVILALKYGQLRAAGPRLGRGMAALWKPPGLDALVPVPLHPGSLREYNQAFEIARGLGHEWGVRVMDIARWSRVLPARTGLTGEQRMSLRPDAFLVSERVRGLRIALVDDVCTTGATLVCLASACRGAGAIVAGACTVASTE